MKNSSGRLASLMAVAGIAMAASPGINFPTLSNYLGSQPTLSDHELEMEFQKRKAMQQLNEEQREWNEVVDAKRKAKKAGKV